jgi:hypothetical protein
MVTPIEREAGVSLSPAPPTGEPLPGGQPPRNWYDGRAVLQQIGWRRPSADERRWWLVQGAVILGGVLAIGLLMVLALR